MKRPCLSPGCPALVTTTRCPAHTRTTAQRGYGAEWQRISKAARAAHPYCAVCGTPDDLTTDHVVSGDPRLIQVLCRGCNSKKARASR